MVINYRQFYKRCLQRYPNVVLDLAPGCRIKRPEKLIKSYFETTGHDPLTISRNRDQACVVFVATIAKAMDRDFFTFRSNPPKGLTKEAEKQTGMSARKISYFLKKSQIFWPIYPDFRNKVDEICTKITQDEIIPNKDKRQESQIHND